MGSSSESVVRIMSAEEIVAGAGRVPDNFIWPDRRTWFLERVMRFKQLARNHPTAPYMELMSTIAQAQHEALAEFPEVRLPDKAYLAESAKHGVAPLPAIEWQRDSAWRDALHHIVNKVSHQYKGTEVEAVLQKLSNLSESELETQADLILAGSVSGLDVGAAPFIGAALQVYWLHMISSSEALRSGSQYASLNLDETANCPCCGCPPVASVTHASAKVAGQRYLVCSLCGTQWNMVRIRCTRCFTEEGITYMSLSSAETPDERAAKAAIQAETCDSCNSYLKIMHTERDPSLDPFADDIASIALDVLMSENNKVKHGSNPMLVFASDTNTE